jgi:DNA-binding MurR/RpiR family transcriptional regulator
MGNRQQIQDISSTLRITLENARAEYGETVRRVRWGEGPIYVCGAGDCASMGVAASYAFESLLGWPVVVRPVEVFRDYAISLLRPRSVLVMIFTAGEWPEAQELAHLAHERRCTLMGLTNDPESPLAKMLDLILLARAEGNTDSPSVAVCLHAALNLLAFEVARALKRPEPHWDELEKEFDKLPEQIDWVFTQLSAVVRSAAAEVARFPRLRIVGGGFNHYPAWRAAQRLRLLAGLPVEGIEASEFWSGLANFARRDDAVLFLSSSRAKNRKLIHRCAAQTRVNGARVLSLTDGNDRELVECSDLGTLIPSLMEMPGCTMTLFMLEWLVFEVLRATRQSPAAH